jgi:SRSO17 transposase
VEGAAGRLRRHFRRPEAAEHAADYLRGLVAEVERKNGWQLAEEAGYSHPRGMQRVLDRYAWDADAVREDLRAYVVAGLGHPGGVLVVDETGFPKQGRHSAGVARQYCGTLGKRANCQIGVFLGYASPKGHAGLDRALYVPQEWTDDRARCRQAGIPDQVPFRTKPQLALELVEQALDAGVPAAWVAADEVYGDDGKFRRALEARDQAYVVAVRRDYPVSTWPPYGPPAAWTVSSVVAAALTAGAVGWRRRSAGAGAQGPRLYDWLFLAVRPALQDGWLHAVLVRRHPKRTDELAYYLVYAPVGTSLAKVVAVAGARWSIEDMFKQAKGLVGLDQYEVRSWHGWYRHITLALLALAALTIATKKGGPAARSGAPPTSRLPSRKSVASWSGSSGRRPTHARRSPRSWRGPVGAAATRRSLKHATNAAA